MISCMVLSIPLVEVLLVVCDVALQIRTAQTGPLGFSSAAELAVTTRCSISVEIILEGVQNSLAESMVGNELPPPPRAEPYLAGRVCCSGGQGGGRQRIRWCRVVNWTLDERKTVVLVQEPYFSVQQGDSTCLSRDEGPEVVFATRNCRMCGGVGTTGWRSRCSLS